MQFGDYTTVMILNFSDRSVWANSADPDQILEEQSDQGLRCLLFHLHVFDKIPSGFDSLFEFKVNYSKVFASENLGTLRYIQCQKCLG